MDKNKYYIAIQYPMPYEILVNDVLVSKDTKEGYTGAENINLFLNSNQKQRIRIRVFANNFEKGGLIPKGFLASLKGTLYTIDSAGGDKEKLILSLNFPENKQAISSFEYEWQFDNIAKVDHDRLKNAKNLNDIDKTKLTEMVLTRFNELRAILNSGDGKKSMSVIATAKDDVFAAEAMSSSKQKEYDENLTEYFDSHKGIMPEIKNYKLRIMGNGKAVAMENTLENKGLGVLSSEDRKDNTLNKNYIILYMPNNSTQFEVFRYNCSFTSLD